LITKVPDNGRTVELVDSDTHGTEQLDRLLGENTLDSSTIVQTPIVDELPEVEPASTEVTEHLHIK